MRGDPEDKARRAQRERDRRAAMRAAGIPPRERTEEEKAKHAELERGRRKRPEVKAYNREQKQKYRDENRERFRAYSREHQRRRRAKLKLLGLPDPHATPPEYSKAYRARDPVGLAFRRRASTYKCPVETQKDMLKAQLWRCANLACRAELSGRSMQLDHCHATGKVRAFLCGDCNAALGRMGDCPDKIRGLADYIERF